MDGLEYTFKNTVKIWQGSKSTWYYVNLPLTVSDEVHTLSQYHQTKRRGWGAVKVNVMSGEQQWTTSIFPAFEGKRFALFLKADVRKQLGLVAGSEVNVTIQILF